MEQFDSFAGAANLFPSRPDNGEWEDYAHLLGGDADEDDAPEVIDDDCIECLDLVSPNEPCLRVGEEWGATESGPLLYGVAVTSGVERRDELAAVVASASATITSMVSACSSGSLDRKDVGLGSPSTSGRPVRDHHLRYELTCLAKVSALALIMQQEAPVHSSEPGVKGLAPGPSLALVHAHYPLLVPLYVPQ
eukprot:2670261-Rhodomonas_salina.1